MENLSRPAPHEYAPYYGTYVVLVGTGPVVRSLEMQAADTCSLLENLTEEQAGFAYAPGKWTVKQVVGHVLDTERVLSYRLLRAARGDQATPLAGYDDASWAATWDLSGIALSSLLDEYRAVRASTLFLLRHLAEADWDRRVQANGADFTVRALAYIIAGHELHHAAALRTRYLS